MRLAAPGSLNFYEVDLVLYGARWRAPCPWGPPPGAYRARAGSRTILIGRTRPQTCVGKGLTSSRYYANVSTMYIRYPVARDVSQSLPRTTCTGRSSPHSVAAADEPRHAGVLLLRAPSDQRVAAPFLSCLQEFLVTAARSTPLILYFLPSCACAD